jgi:hypothetical protein
MSRLPYCPWQSLILCHRTLTLVLSHEPIYLPRFTSDASIQRIPSALERSPAGPRWIPTASASCPDSPCSSGTTRHPGASPHSTSASFQYLVESTFSPYPLQRALSPSFCGPMCVPYSARKHMLTPSRVPQKNHLFRTRFRSTRGSHDPFCLIAIRVRIGAYPRAWTGEGAAVENDRLGGDAWVVWREMPVGCR